MGTSKILYKFGLAKIWVIRISSTLPQSSAIRLQRGNLPKFGSSGADAYETTGRTQVKEAHRLTVSHKVDMLIWKNSRSFEKLVCLLSVSYSILHGVFLRVNFVNDAAEAHCPELSISPVNPAATGSQKFPISQSKVKLPRKRQFSEHKMEPSGRFSWVKNTSISYEVFVNAYGLYIVRTRLFEVKHLPMFYYFKSSVNDHKCAISAVNALFFFHVMIA